MASMQPLGVSGARVWNPVREFFNPGLTIFINFAQTNKPKMQRFFSTFFFQVPAVRFFFLGKSITWHASNFIIWQLQLATTGRSIDLASTVTVVCESKEQEIVSFHINWWANEIKWDQMSTCLGFQQKPIERFIYHSNLQPFLCDTRGARNGRRLILISFERDFKLQKLRFGCFRGRSKNLQNLQHWSFQSHGCWTFKAPEVVQPISYVTEDGKFATRFFSGREREISTVALYAKCLEDTFVQPMNNLPSEKER